MANPETGACSVRPSGDPIPWRNWAGNQEVYPSAIYRPKNLDELVCIVQEVTARNGRLRGVGTGLSFSDILQTDDALLQLTDLRAEGDPGALLPLEQELWTNPTPDEPRVRIPAGARIGALNDALAAAGLAFINLGGYDGQTMVGALSTSTHGSGIGLGPLPDAVLSIDLVTSRGKQLRIEPEGGITDRVKFDQRYRGKMDLCQSNDVFYSVVVSLGCMGVIAAVTMRVRAAYRLTERRTIANWSEVKRELAGGVLNRYRHYEVSLNPYPQPRGDYTCLVTTRSVAKTDTAKIPLPESRTRAEALLFLASSQRGILRIVNETPRFIPYILEEGLRQLKTDEHVDDSYRIYNWGDVNTAQVISGEYFFAVGDVSYATSRLLATIAANRRRGVWQNGPISLRFIKESPAYLSMMAGRNSCSMEIPMFSGAPGAVEALLSYEQTAYECGGRVHWGQVHELSGRPGWLMSSYPKARTFQRVYRTLNALGTFSNHFTDRMKL